MYRSKATILTSKSLTTLSKVCRQQPQSLKIFTFSKNLSTASQISEFDNYNSLKDENYSNFQQNPDEGFNYDSKNRDSLNKDWIFNGNSKKIEQNPNGVYRQNPRSEFQEPTSKGFQQNLFAQNDNLTSRFVDFSSRNEFQQKPPAQNENFSSGRVDFSPRNEFQQKPYAQNENFSSGLVDFSPSNEFQQKPYAQNENFSSGRVDFSPRNEFQQNQHGQNENFSSGRVNVASRNEFQQTVWGNGSSDFVSRNDYRSNLVEHNRSDSGYHGESSSKSRFEGGVQAQLGQNGVKGNYYQNLNGYNGGNIGVPQQSFPNYNRGNVRNVQSGNSGTYPQSVSGYNMERNVGSSGYSTEMIGQYQQNVGGFNASSTGNQVSYQYQNVMVGHEEMRSLKPVEQSSEQSSESADSSNIKGSIEELDNFCKEVKLKEAVEVLHLLEQQHVTVDLSRYIMLMDVCGEDKSLEEAKSVHEHLVRSHPHLDVKMYNKILEMYGKCGSMKDAFLVFQKMPQRNLTSWDAMITWLGKNGLGEDAIELFAEFKKTEMKPDGQMFLGVFHACSVVGDIVEGMLHFDSMNKDYGIVYSMEHYVGVVDMLGSTGYLDEAMDFIEKMPIEPTVEVWETMMNLCRIHGNLELGDRCAEIVEFLDPSRLDEQSKAGFLPVKVSDIAKEKEKKKFAQSLLEARSRVHEYRAGDRSHPDHEKIYELLRGLKQLMKEDGYIPEVKFVLHDVDQETKEDALMAHSERLAFAQGLMNSSARSPIRIIKNLRVCGDCHNALKIASRLVGREIIMRDAKRFHHLKDGLCSCRDYW